MQHHITYQGPTKFVEQFIAALTDAALEFEVIPLFSERRSGGDRFDAMAVPASGDFDLIERTCARFVTLWPMVHVTVDGARIAPDWTFGL